MGKDSKIAWTNHTFNHVMGCTKISEGCVNCYAENETPCRVKKIKWGDDGERHITSREYWEKPLRWNKEAHTARTVFSSTWFNDRPRVFCASLADWLDPKIDPKITAGLLDLIACTPELDWLLLTKRIENWRDTLTKTLKFDTLSETAEKWLQGVAPKNVWLGVTVELAKYHNRYLELANIPATVRFISNEPALDDICLDGLIAECARQRLPNPDWYIYGGESAVNHKPARPANVMWPYKAMRTCKQHGISCFIKQMGSHVYSQTPDNVIEFKGRKGEMMEDWLPDLRLQEIPFVEMPKAT